MVCVKLLYTFYVQHNIIMVESSDIVLMCACTCMHLLVGNGVCVHARVCVHVCVCVCMHACVCVCARAHAQAQRCTSEQNVHTCNQY